MDGNLALRHAHNLVYNYLKDNYSEYATIDKDLITTVWACKTAENNKVILTYLDPGFELIFEVTFRGTVNHVYLDVYSHVHHEDRTFSVEDKVIEGIGTYESK